MPSAIYYWEDVLRLDSEIDWKAVLQFKFGILFDNRIKQFILNYSIKLFRQNLTSIDGKYQRTICVIYVRRKKRRCISCSSARKVECFGKL